MSSNVNATALIAYVLCALVSIACSLLLFRSWGRSRSTLVLRCAWGFAFVGMSNVMLVADLLIVTDLSILRAVLIAIGLGVLLWGVLWEESR